MTSALHVATPTFPLTLRVTTLLAVFIGGGCGHLQPAAPQTVVAVAAPVVSLPSVRPSESAPVRHVGDVFVHRFSGSFASEPLTLTEEVTAREDAAWVVDYSLTQGEAVQRLRVRFDARTGQAVSAAQLEGSRETPAKLADYEGLLSRTVYAADVNDGLVSETNQTCLVGADELDCETKTYRVWIGDAAATLSVAHSNAFADRDVSGEITTEEGQLVYRAELVEARQGKPALGVASR